MTWMISDREFLIKELFFLIFVYLASPGLNYTHRIFHLCCSMQTLSCSIWNTVPPPGIEPGSPALGVQSLSH